jgi:hypothetical protein
MMTRKTIFTVFIALAAWPALGGPCCAQDSPVDIPVLKQYVGPDWVYFASAGDEALIFEKRPKDGSNVGVAVERAAINRRILANTDIWNDSRGRLHTVGVLKLQLEYNEYLKKEERLWGPNTTGASALAETGILDCKTLAIPHAKLAPRAKRIADRLADEDAAAERLMATNPSAATLKKKYAAYLWEKSWAATARLDELNQAVFAVPTSRAEEESPVLRPDAVNLRGLRGLDAPNASPYYFKLMNEDSGAVRFVSVSDTFLPERFIAEFVDPLGMTPAIAADLQEKTAAAEKAVIAAEYLCRELLTPPCP